MLDEGVSYAGEPPETPAPLFVVRAFKTAIFGTPHPVQREAKLAGKASEKDKAGTQRLPSEKPEDRESIERDTDTGVEIERAASIRLDTLASPAKGILLTPGTTATRRKTVSFLHLEDSDAGKPTENLFQDVELNMDPLLTPCKRAPESQSRDQPRHSQLTKTLLELSKQKSERKGTSGELDVQSPKPGALVSTAIQTESNGSAVEVTMDLSKPRSRSGQHWKTEYEQYQRRSNREMKEIIKYGQKVKSYAAKKDAEATGLSEKLKKELAKVARMESRVSKLAAQLNAAQGQGPEGESEQARLVSELAQQTALAIRYKQKVDHYKAAISEQNAGETADDDEQDDSQAAAKGGPRGKRLLSQPEANEDPALISEFQAQLEDLHRVSQAAEDRVGQLKAENRELKRSLARVKQEMMSYETRRQAREERLKRSEAKHRAAREECEKRLAQLTAEHHELLRMTNRRPITHETPRTHATQLDGITPKLRENRRMLKGGVDENAPPTGVDVKTSKSSNSPRKSWLQKTAVDIWTSNSPPEIAGDKTHIQEQTQLAPSSVKYDICRTLKEIDQNLVSEKEAKGSPIPTPIHPNTDSYPKSLAPSQNSRSISPLMPDKKLAIESSTLHLVSSPAKLQPAQSTDLSYSKPSMATVGRSASLFMGRGGSRTGTMGSVRGSALPADRAAAAKARLAKRSAEKKRQQASGS